MTGQPSIDISLIPTLESANRLSTDPARFAVIVPTYGEFPYVLKCLESLARCTSDYRCYVIDDASPGWTSEIENAIRRTIPSERLHFERWEENRGLTAAWNHGLELARLGCHPYAALVNSDTLFSPGWLLRTAEALDKADLVGPLTNAPSDSRHQEIRNVIRGYRLDDSAEACAEISHRVRAKFSGKLDSGTINGFWMAAKTEMWWANAFDATHVFDPKNRLTGNESEFEKRFKGRIAAMHDVFIFHYRSVSRGLENVEAQYCRGAFRLPEGASSGRLNPSYISRRSDLVAFIPKTVTSLLDVGCSVGAVGAALKQRQAARVTGLEYDPEMAEIARANLDLVFSGNAEEFPVEKLREHGPFDGLLFADVLEHLRDPWQALIKYSSLLTPGAAVIASLPNVRHFTTLASVFLRGYWPYRERGVHDRTHLRWFTKRNIEELFELANLRIERVDRIYRIIERPHSYNERFAHRFAVGPLRELLTYQYYVLARKR